MIELSSEEERSLRELVENRTDTESVDRFIRNRLYSELSRETGKDRFGASEVEFLPGYYEQRQVYESLVDKGLLTASRPTPMVTWYGDLTPAGRCYFIDKAAREAEERERIRSDRIHDYKVACLSFAGGAVAGGIVTLLLRLAFGL